MPLDSNSLNTRQATKRAKRQKYPLPKIYKQAGLLNYLTSNPRETILEY